MWHFDMPLAWLNGAIIATGLSALFGLPVVMPAFARPPMTAAIGAMLGMSFSPAMFEHADSWLLSLGGLAIFIAAESALAYIYFRPCGRIRPSHGLFLGDARRCRRHGDTLAGTRRRRENDRARPGRPDNLGGTCVAVPDLEDHRGRDGSHRVRFRSTRKRARQRRPVVLLGCFARVGCRVIAAPASRLSARSHVGKCHHACRGIDAI
ncbi:hypothetical protein EHS39_34725 [Ensifer sp. MPMI2T]|nr:hypothetical protein EHS39_34725 [Ensifer sp. MPMI2T]